MIKAKNKHFELNDKEQESLERWYGKLRKKYGSCGIISYKFTPVGIGRGFEVQSSHNKDKWKDFTDYEGW